MPQRGDVSALRWLVGNELRSARLAAGKTLVEAGVVLGSSHAKINYLEIGRNHQQPAEIEALLRFYGASDDDVRRLISLASRTEEKSWSQVSRGAPPEWMRVFVGLEQLASHHFMYVPLIFAGMVQCAAYTEALLQNNIRVAAADVHQVVALRRERQRRLTADRGPLQFSTIVDDIAFDRLVGGAETMEAQLSHMLALSSRDNVTIQVMPTSVSVHDGIDGGFATLDFVEARTVGYAEFPAGAIYLQAQSEVDEYVLAEKRMKSVALSVEDSREFMRERLDKLRAKSAG